MNLFTFIAFDVNRVEQPSRLWTENKYFHIMNLTLKSSSKWSERYGQRFRTWCGTFMQHCAMVICFVWCFQFFHSILALFFLGSRLLLTCLFFFFPLFHKNLIKKLLLSLHSTLLCCVSCLNQIITWTSVVIPTTVDDESVNLLFFYFTARGKTTKMLKCWG